MSKIKAETHLCFIVAYVLRICKKCAPRRIGSNFYQTEAEGLQRAKVAHGFKSPLTVLQSGLELLESGNYSDSGLIYTSMKSSVADLAHLTREILGECSAQTYVVPNNDSLFCVSDTLLQTAKEMRLAALVRTISFTANVPGDVYFFGDKRKIKELVANVLHNAILYTEKSNVRTVSLTLTSTKSEICIFITDSGVGMSAYEAALLAGESSVVERYSHGRTCHGLGLRIVKKILAEYQGTLEIDSTLGKGTKVYIRLPTPKEISLSLVPLTLSWSALLQDSLFLYS